MMKHFDHLIEVLEHERILRIYRVDGDGSKQFYTETELPKISDFDVQREEFAAFAQMLGESILADAPAIRRIYNL